MYLFLQYLVCKQISTMQIKISDIGVLILLTMILDIFLEFHK